VVVCLAVLTIPFIKFFSQIKNSTNLDSLQPGNNQIGAGDTNTTNTNNDSTQSSKITLTTTEVAKHNTADDCWLIINDSVYDVSSYVQYHPGGLAMVPYCGREATNAFNTKGGQGNPIQVAPPIFWPTICSVQWAPRSPLRP